MRLRLARGELHSRAVRLLRAVQVALVVQHEPQPEAALHLRGRWSDVHRREGRGGSKTLEWKVLRGVQR